MKATSYIVIFVVSILLYHNSYAQTKNAGSDEYAFLKSRKSFKTNLIRKMLPPDDQKSLIPPPNVREVYYYSDDLKLKAWLCIPEKKKEKMPAIVYFHGGFSLKPSERIS